MRVSEGDIVTGIVLGCGQEGDSRRHQYPLTEHWAALPTLPIDQAPNRHSETKVLSSLLKVTVTAVQIFAPLVYYLPCEL